MRTPVWQVIVLSLLASVGLYAADRSWYTNASFHCDDPFSLQHTYMDAGWYTRYLDLTFTSVSTEKGYVQISKSDYDAIGSSSQGSLLEQHLLTKSNVIVLRTKLKGIAQDKVVPAAISLTGALATYLGLGNFFTKSLLHDLASKAAVQQVNAAILSEVTAPGGNLNRALTTAKADNGNEYLIHTFEYEVVIGSETRHYITVSCTYPLKLLFHEFRTVNPINNKIVRKGNGATWVVIDASTNREEEIWKELDRDNDYLYFTGPLSSLYRVSLRGGPVQKKFTNTWYNLYPKTKGS